jgi:hypothetical protein
MTRSETRADTMRVVWSRRRVEQLGTIHEIAEKIAQENGVEVEVFRKSAHPKKDRKTMRLRRLLIARAREAGVSWSALAEWMGYEDRNTVRWHGDMKFRQLKEGYIKRWREKKRAGE